MRKYVQIGILVAGLAATSAANAAGFLKLDSVKGESAKPAPAAPERVKPQGEAAQGLLLPAVQKPREAAAAKPAEPAEKKKKKKGNVEYTWKVEEGEK